MNRETIEEFLARGGAIQQVEPGTNPDHDEFLRRMARRDGINRASRSNSSRSKWFAKGEGTF